MENTMQQTANLFWQTHFPELVGDRFTERQALDSDFWNRLQAVFDETDVATVYAVLLSNPAMRVETTDMFTRIKRLAKWAWDAKRD